LLFIRLCYLQKTSKTNSHPEPVQIAVAGLTHDHVHWIFGRDNIGDIEIVGSMNPMRIFGSDTKTGTIWIDTLHFTELEAMLDKIAPGGSYSIRFNL
jgi:hypothetical protein